MPISNNQSDNLVYKLQFLPGVVNIMMVGVLMFFPLFLFLYL